LRKVLGACPIRSAEARQRRQLGEVGVLRPEAAGEPEELIGERDDALADSRVASAYRRPERT
jgi:hypothetical protein